jgi:type II secretory pathway component GspD/PulD (secretin)
MKSHFDAAARRGSRSTQIVAAFLLAIALASPAVRVQAQSADAKPSTEIDQTIFLTSLTQQHDLNDVVTDLRNMLGGHTKIYLVASQNAISIHGTPQDVQFAQKLIAELDRPRKIYRLTYTISETDNGKRTGTQTIALVAASGEKTTFKQGSKVPIVTGSFDNDSSKANTQVQYLDVGLNIEFTAEGRADGLNLRSKIEQSSLTEQRSGVGPQDPVLSQSVLEASTALALGKPMSLGMIDIPGTTRKQEISVVSELVK